MGSILAVIFHLSSTLALSRAISNRERLERLNERFIAAGQADVRAALLDASQQIAAWIDAPDAANAARVEAALTLAETRVTREASRSLYAPHILRAALGE
jgi:hypothetical protein